MKPTAFFLFALLGLTLVAQPDRQLTVARQGNVKLPWGLSGLTVIDSTLYGYSSGTRFMGLPASLRATDSRRLHRPGYDNYIGSFSPDTILNHISDEMNYLVRNPHDSLFYFTVVERGVSRLYVHRSDRGWGRDKAVKPKDWKHEICHPAFSSDGLFMVFSANVPGGLGGYDLWCSGWDGKQWSKPVNLGNKVNTPGNDIHPLFYADKLLFASNGYSGPDSNYNLFSSDFPHPQAYNPDNLIFHDYLVQRLPEPLNSDADDWELAVAPDGTYGYWVSTRSGKEELYQFDGRLDGTAYLGRVTDTNGQPLAGVVVTARHQGRIVYTSVTGANGRYSLFVQPGLSYQIQADSRGRFSHRATLPTVRPQPQYLIAECNYDITLRSFPIGEAIVIGQVFGDNANVDITESGRNAVAAVAQFLIDNPDLHAELAVNSNASGGSQFNVMLSKQRLNVLQEYIQSLLPSEGQISYLNGNESAPERSAAYGKNLLSVIFYY